MELTLDGITHGGEAVGRLPDGKACFVPYAVPGERVRVEVVEERKTWARARLLDVVDASPDRATPPCPHFGPGKCGGCQVQHVTPAAQRALKRRIVVEQLQRIGRIPDPPVAPTVAVRDLGYRTSARFAVDAEGRLGFRRAGTHEVRPIDRCPLLADPAQAAREAAGDGWAGVEEVVVRASVADGTGALVVRPGEHGVPPLPVADLPVALADAHGGTVALRGDPVLTETVAGHRFRISPTSFFQTGPDGAAVLADLVLRGAEVRAGEQALDLFAGVGLFSVVLAAAGASVTGVEADRVAAADARANAGDLDVEVVTADAAAWVMTEVAEGGRADVVVLDPPRRGAGVELCRALAALGPRVVVYVSCDPAALARDARGLADAGYDLAVATPVDQFAQTAQVETVAVFHPAVDPAVPRPPNHP